MTSSSTLAARSAAATPTEIHSPWWREPFMWMVVGGPLTVVIAGFATLAIAIAYPDPVISVKASSNSADMPAIQGRNHAATPKP